jgi:hypothetical protein
MGIIIVRRIDGLPEFSDAPPYIANPNGFSPIS